jgi:hypothetical protein
MHHSHLEAPLPGPEGGRSAAAALRLAPQLDGAAGQLLQSGALDVVKAGMRALLAAQQQEAKSTVRAILSYPNREARDAAVAFFVATSDREELMQLLEEYEKQSPCHYTVVCMLDKVLYAPGKLREALTAEIRTIL